MKTKPIKSILVFAAMLSFTATVSAEDVESPRVHKPDPRAATNAKLLEHYDINKNSKLDPAEIEAIGRERMLENDRNKDGHVDQFELKHPRAGVRRMPEMDALQRAMARERALSAARIQLEKDQSKAADKAVDGSTK